ncbi:MAG: DUF362 domain-containing protein [Candidatus Bathyarchaeota archaeon]|nr:MAG: DUF362 domain-containing protein [Candidatus Bathyarchaeota archaeon]
MANTTSSADLRGLLDDPWFKSETIIVKPNWVETKPALFTDCETLRILLESLDSKVVVVEGHQIGRSMKELPEGMSFTLEGKERNWLWLMRGGWSWLERNPGWGWFRDGGHWDQIQREEELFLDCQGFTDLFREMDVEYVNVTDEIWSGRTVDPAVIKGAVESRFKPVSEERLYGYVPRRLYELRGATLISFAKVKQYATFSMKNLFGLIPDPLRAWWHGPKNSRFDDSVIGINKVYTALFNVYGVCEALRRTAILNPEGEVEVPGFRYDVAEGLGMVALGRHLVSLDAIVCALAGFEFKDASYLEGAGEEFGAYNMEVVEEAMSKASEWFPGMREK